jgi:hypothetical protein
VFLCPGFEGAQELRRRHVIPWAIPQLIEILGIGTSLPGRKGNMYFIYI